MHSFISPVRLITFHGKFWLEWSDDVDDGMRGVDEWTQQRLDMHLSSVLRCGIRFISIAPRLIESRTTEKIEFNDFLCTKKYVSFAFRYLIYDSVRRKCSRLNAHNGKHSYLVCPRSMMSTRWTLAIVWPETPDIIRRYYTDGTTENVAPVPL